MSPHDAAAGSPEHWIARAKSSLALAQVKKPEDTFWEDLCFHAQQATEKALKAVLLKRGARFRFVHDLDELITELEKNDIDVPTHVQECRTLTEYAVQTRYPGNFEPVLETEYHEAIHIATEVVAWALSAVRTTSQEP